ncbi:hypothetical protein MKX01_028373 [Papaver californicum]|nr:hypothetical protein MKX01_028373 [Papaver californicum]
MEFPEEIDKPKRDKWNNNTVSDTKSNLNKEFLEPVNFDYQAQKPTVSEEISVLRWPEEVAPLSTEVSKLDDLEKIHVPEWLDEVTPPSTGMCKSAVVLEKFAALQLPDDATPLWYSTVKCLKSGNSVLAQGILARLNHQLSHPIGKPLYRAAFYFKEALLQLHNGTPNSPPPLKNFSPLYVVLKIGNCNENGW